MRKLSKLMFISPYNFAYNKASFRDASKSVSELETQTNLKMSAARAMHNFNLFLPQRLVLSIVEIDFHNKFNVARITAATASPPHG